MLISATQGTGVEKGGHIYTALSRSSLDAFLRNASCVSVKRLQGLITWLDTFDLRLLRAGNRLYLHKNELYFKSAIEIYPDVMKIRRRPAFSDDFSDPAFRRQIEPVMGNRALAPLIAVNASIEFFYFLDRNQKTIMQMTVEQTMTGDQGPVFVQTFPLKGYSAFALEIYGRLMDAGFKKSRIDFLRWVIRTNDVSVEYPELKRTFQIVPDAPAGKAVKQIHRQLLRIMSLNENGIIKDIDTEFLHDFRVAIRRIRALYGLPVDFIDPGIVQQARTDFTGLGKRTNRLRDIDVYLSRRSDYNDMLPAGRRTALVRFFEQLIQERKQVHSSLVRFLRSRRYHNLKRKWEILISDEEKSIPAQGPTVKIFAASQISDLYRSVLEKGVRIDEHTPDRKLHKLRIACKKLRYTTEFFAGLFDADAVCDFITHLKRLQDNLGAFNDLSLQQRDLHGFAVESENGEPPSDEQKISFGMLIGSLYQQQQIIRNQFREYFGYFSETGDLNWLDRPDIEHGEQGNESIGTL
jgi:CHAD domain-containing protein